MNWRIAPSLIVLRDEVNASWPARDKASDGFIGDAAHAATASDHNPNSEGVVCAFDITHDPNGPDGTALAERLRALRHPTTKYVIWDRRMFSAYAAHGVDPYEWRPYSGADPHTNHVHVSVGVGPDGRSQPGTYNDTTPWLTQQEDELSAQAEAQIEAIYNAVKEATNGIEARVARIEACLAPAGSDHADANAVDKQLKSIRKSLNTGPA